MTDMTISLTEAEVKALSELSAATDLSVVGVLRQALRLYQMIHHRVMEGERVMFSGDQQRTIDFAGYGIHTPKQPDTSYGAAEEMLRDLIPVNQTSDTMIRVARDHMVSFARRTAT